MNKFLGSILKTLNAYNKLATSKPLLTGSITTGILANLSFFLIDELFII